MIFIIYILDISYTFNTLYKLLYKYMIHYKLFGYIILLIV